MHKEITYHLEPGYVYVGKEKSVIRTVLGSCVAVCLWDTKNKIGGMNHFLYPVARNDDKPTAQYGNVSTPKLVRMMEEMGCARQDLIAQIFGGGYPMHTKNHRVGERNVEVARRILKKKQIHVVSEDVGGGLGRKILFDTETGHVVVLKVHSLRGSDWVDRDPGDTNAQSN